MKFLPAKIAICVLILCIIVAGWGVIIPYGIIVGVLYISYLLIKALRQNDTGVCGGIFRGQPTGGVKMGRRYF